MYVRVDPDLTGRTFGEWIVLGLSDKKTKCGAKMWDCVCSCGNGQAIPTSNLTKGCSTRCQDCGAKQSGLKHTTHGETRTNLYYTWIARITGDCVPEWKDFPTFKRDVMPKGGKHLLKRDHNAPFGPTNFRWADHNTPDSEMETIGGLRNTLYGWASVLGVSKQRIYQLAEAHGSLSKAIELRAERARLSVEETIHRFSELNWTRIMNPPERTHNSKYSDLPWDEWMNGKTHEAEQGVHFTGDVANFRSALAARAKKNGLKVRTRIDWDNTGKVFFRFEKLEAGHAEGQCVSPAIV